MPQDIRMEEEDVEEISPLEESPVKEGLFKTLLSPKDEIVSSDDDGEGDVQPIAQVKKLLQSIYS